MLDGVHRDAAEHIGRGIAEALGRPGMGALVHAERKDQDKYLEQDQYKFLAHATSLLEGNKRAE